MLNLAVIGAGYMGSLHVSKFLNIPDVRIQWICDLKDKSANDLAEKSGSKQLSDYRDIPLESIQAVVVASDTSSHYEIANYFLSNSIHVLLEKPAATTLEEARTLAELSQETGAILQLGHLERFNPVVKKLKSSLREPKYYEIKRITPFRGRGSDVDVILDLMIHDIDLLVSMIGGEVIKIDAIGVPVLTNFIDLAQVRLEFSSKVVANLSVSRVSLSSERTIRVFQPNEYLSLDLVGRKFRSLRVKGDTLGDSSFDSEEISFSEADPLMDQATAFCMSINGIVERVNTGDEILRVMKIVERIKAAISESLAESPSSSHNTLPAFS